MSCTPWLTVGQHASLHSDLGQLHDSCVHSIPSLFGLLVRYAAPTSKQTLMSGTRVYVLCKRVCTHACMYIHMCIYIDV